MDCDRIVAILTLDGGTSEQRSVTTYGDAVAYPDRGATFESESLYYTSTPIVRTYCQDPTPEIGEIMGVELRSKTGFSITESGTYPNSPERSYQTEQGEVLTGDPLNFWILNTRSGPDYFLPGVTPPSEVTPLATTKPGIQDRDFRVWIGDRNAIDQWIRLNSLTIDIEQTFPNFAGGESKSSTYQYQGWRIACSFPYDALLKYPFCGGLVQGEEAKGPQFINLCENDLGVCSEDCCDCCSIGEKLLAELKSHPLYK